MTLSDNDRPVDTDEREKPQQDPVVGFASTEFETQASRRDGSRRAHGSRQQSGSVVRTHLFCQCAADCWSKILPMKHFSRCGLFSPVSSQDITPNKNAVAGQGLHESVEWNEETRHFQDTGSGHFRVWTENGKSLV